MIYGNKLNYYIRNLYMHYNVNKNLVVRILLIFIILFILLIVYFKSFYYTQYYIIFNKQRLYITNCYDCGKHINLCTTEGRFKDIILINGYEYLPYNRFSCQDESMLSPSFIIALKEFYYPGFAYVLDSITQNLYFYAANLFVSIHACEPCGKEFGNVCEKKPIIYDIPHALIKNLINGDFDCDKHIEESYKPKFLTRSSNYFSISNNQRHFIHDCFSCGPMIDLCDSKHVLNNELNIYNSGYEKLEVGLPFTCCKHASDSLLYSLRNYNFEVPTFVAVRGTHLLYFAHKNNFDKIVTCFDCGSAFGNLCTRHPHIKIPTCVAEKLYSARVFQCHKHFTGISNEIKKYRSISVVTTAHTLTLANLIAATLKSSFVVDVTHDMPSDFNKDLYFVLAANIYKTLPPPDKRILYQLEQSINSRWFTPSYINALKESFAVFDYHPENIKTLEEKYSIRDKIWYLPVGVNMELYKESINSETVKEWDLIFYGDVHGRRGPILDALRKRFKINIVTEIFGEKMLDLIRRARYVVNIHYYENGLLELPRIYESLSLGVPVISEDSSDRSLHADLISPLIYFWKYNSTESMIEVISRLISTPLVKNPILNSIATLSHNHFSYMLHRALMGLNIYAETNINLLVPFIPQVNMNDTRPIILSLPEAVSRRKLFLAQMHPGTSLGVNIFALKHIYLATWISFALSYSLIAKVAIRDNLLRLTIAEDTAMFSTHFDQNLEIIHDYLNNLNNSWHVFSGLITDLPFNATILKSEYYRGILFVTIDKLTGMVFNIYNRNIYDVVANWDALNENAVENSIDLFIEHTPNFRVITTFPFMVGHYESTEPNNLNFQNSEYKEVIKKSSQKFSEKLSDYNARNY